MAHVIVLGAGLGGVPMALELRQQLHETDKLTVICNLKTYQFAPSNPWLAVGWRKRSEIEVALAPVYKKRDIEFIPVAAERVDPDKNRIELSDGRVLGYDYLVIATGPALTFDEVQGLGPEVGFTQSICRTDHAENACTAWLSFIEKPTSIVVGAAQGAACFGPAYEFAMIMDTDLRRRKIRDKVLMTFVTPEPYIGHLGLGGIGDTKGLLESPMRERSIRWIFNASVNRAESGKLIANEHSENGARKKNMRYRSVMPC
jgi:sulfide:quinone oxidoreductase